MNTYEPLKQAVGEASSLRPHAARSLGQIVSPRREFRLLSRTKKRILILGTGPLALELCQSILANRARGYEVVGFLDQDAARVGKRLVNPSIIGTFQQLFELVEHLRVNMVAVCLEDRRRCLPLDMLLDCKSLGLEIIDGHQLVEQESGRLSIDLLNPSHLIFSTGFRRITRIMVCKRIIDMVVSSLGLVMLAPLFLGIALLIKVESQGPVFYRQVRVGRHGRPFVICKFRSMINNAEQEQACWASVHDPRVTKIGQWLRKWRIDELPQLINVLKGEMSLVGPRPERPVFVNELQQHIPYYHLRHTIRPGITGWAQIRYRYAASSEDSHLKLQYDLYYLKNLSLGLDAQILAETARVVVCGIGAR